MTNRDTETRNLTFVDLPLLHRISDRAVVLDTELEYTRDVQGPGGAILSSILLPQRNLYTLVARSDKQHVVGQFRLRGDEHLCAHIVYIAPALAAGADDTVWMHVLDAITREAGKQQAQTLIGEIDEDSPLFETMRHSGFAVYSRQQIWRRLPGDYACIEPNVDVVPAKPEDDYPVHLLISRLVPNMMHPFTLPVELENGWVVHSQGRLRAYIQVTEGRHGIYLMPFISPDVMEQAPAILHGVIQNLPRAEKQPVYVRTRRYCEWLETALDALQFEPGPTQAVMVRHIAASLRESRSRSTMARLRSMPAVVTAQLPAEHTDTQLMC
jgi:hypothetical protein